MWFIEVGGQVNGFFTRNMFITPDNIEKIRKKFKNTDVYRTQLMYDMEDQNKANKVGDFYLDFDRNLESDDDFNCIREDALKAINYLTTIFQIPRESIRIFFSGNKGVHIIIPANVMGIEPNVNLHRIFKNIAEEIYNYTTNCTLDRKIYDCKRLFRLVNSINGKSGLYKIPLTYYELKFAYLNEIRSLAKNQRNIDFIPPKTSDKARLFYKRYVEEFEEKIRKMSEKRKDSVAFRKLAEYPPCIQKLIESDVPEGQRNNTAIALANFFQQQQMPKDQIEEIMFDWAKSRCSPPIEDSEILSVINSASNHAYKFGCSTLRILSDCYKDKCPFFKK